MLTYKNSYKVLTAVTGLSLLGLTLSVGAQAQYSSTTPMRMDSMSDMDLPDPSSLEYPIAAPGSLDLYHYETYRGITLAPGSVYERRMEIEHMRDMRLHRTPITEDPVAIDPAPWAYPLAAPGGLDLYHYETYRSNTLVPGSVTMARMEKEEMRDRRLHKETRITDDRTMADPAPMAYPIAPAGGINLYHYQTYQENVLSPGSVAEKRESNERKRDMKRHQEMRNNPPSGNQ
jgi:hypothetical protein